MIKSKDASALRDTLKRVLLVATSPGFIPSAKDSLTSLMKDISAEEVVVSEDGEDIDLECMEDEDDSPSIALLIKEVKTAVKECSDDDEPNPYFLSKEVKALESLAMNYVLWSGVMVGAFRSPFNTASSAPSEGDFGDLKPNILKGHQSLLRIPKFVAIHMLTIEGACRITGAAQRHRSEGSTRQETHDMQEDEQANNSETDSNINNDQHVHSGTDEEGPGDLNNSENWNNLGDIKKKKSRRSIYLNANPNMHVDALRHELSIPKKLFIKNGNLSGFVEVNDTVVEISNTCCFDALLQIMSKGFIQNEQFRDEVTQRQDHLFFEAVKLLATEGAKKLLYKKRAEILMAILEPSGELTKTRSKKMRPSYLQYDCWNDFILLAEKLLEGMNSVTYDCIAANHGYSTLIVTPNFDKLIEHGLSSLQNAVD